MSVRIFQGDCRDVLRELPAESVHCAITSPPYWGLRDYNLPPLVWGGDGDDCDHEWGTVVENKRSAGGERDYGSYDGGVGRGPAVVLPESAFCLHCNAWRGSLGLEPTPDLYVAHLVEVMREVRRVLRGDGALWLNLGDSYASAPQIDNYADPKAPRRKPDGRCRTADLKPKDLCGIPWRVAFALQADGWWLRSDVVWHKPNCMPESVTDRPTRAHEYVFLLSKSARYYYDAPAIAEPVKPESVKRCRAGFLGNDPVRDSHNNYGDGFQRGEGYELKSRNKRSVWTIPTHAYKKAHFATFPPALVVPMVKAGTSERGVCPECGAPWRRVVQKSGITYNGERSDDTVYTGQAYGDSPQSAVRGPKRNLPGAESATIGWLPTCACQDRLDRSTLEATKQVAEGIMVAPELLPIPATVLDPFGGSGTVGRVAEGHGRDAIIIDLSAGYCKMARERVGPMFAHVESVESC